MTQYDGSIRIDSRIDPKGFNQGVKGLEGGLKPVLGILAKIALAVVAAFSVKAVLDFTVHVTKLAAEFERLQIAAEAVGQLHGFASGETKKLTQSLIDNGIQTDIANRAFINFAQNGLDANLLPALARGAQDLAVFAESGETSSDVLDRIAYGILNLNELMLRRANVAIDISQAEAEYAKQIGVSTEAMTVQQKRTAVSIAVLEKLKDVQGLYTLSQKTAAGQLASNVRIMNEFKAAIGSTFQGAFYKLIKGWNDLVKVMTASIKAGGVLHELFIRIGTVAAFLADIIVGLFRAIASLFGVELSSAIDTASDDLDTNAGAAGAAADAQGDLASATEAAGKAAKGALASFDELNVLQQDTGDAGAGADGLGAGGFPDGAAADFSKILDEINAKQAEIQARVDALKARLAEVFKPLIDAYNKYLKPALIELGGNIWNGLVWVWENILVPLGKWIADEFGPVFLKFAGSVLDVWNSTWEALKPTLLDIWENILKPFGAWLREVLIKVFEWLTEKMKELSVWIDNNQELFRTIVTVIGIVIAVVLGLIAALATLPVWLPLVLAAAYHKMIEFAGNLGKSIWEALTNAWKNVATWFNDNVIQPLKEFFQPLFEFISIVAYDAWLVITFLWGKLSDWFNETVIQPLTKIFTEFWNDLKTKAATAWEGIKEAFAPVFEWFSKNVTEPIKKAFETASNFIKDKFSGIFTDIKSFAKGAINGIIDLINGMLRGVANGINSVINNLNSVGSAVPGWRIIPGVQPAQIPHLATGGTIPPNAEFLAVLGDNKRENEILAPESTIRRIIREEMGAGGDITIPVTLTLDGEVIYRNQQRVNRRHGGSLIKSGVMR